MWILVFPDPCCRVVLSLSVLVLTLLCCTILLHSSVFMSEHHLRFLLMLYGTLAPSVGQKEAASCTVG